MLGPLINSFITRSQNINNRVLLKSPYDKAALDLPIPAP